ncbi:MAG: ELM1/GtrOC1 family putative glycosyltransferase [Candidatus Omnitrophota bacterium]|nr:ELM1/GtrOC1 family putative glycosyltransferase [Candidatus Omnitrophota bacterium]
MARIDFIIDCALCILFKLTGPLVRCIPKGFSLALGRTLGSLVYCFDAKHRAIAHANMKAAFGHKASPRQLASMTRRFYRTFGENLMEIFFIPLVNKDYLKEYIEIVGRENVDAAFKRGKGVILLAMHEGSWELSNIICAHLAFPFNFFVRDQRYPRLDNILNTYRFQLGCRVIHRGNQIRQLLQVLSRNEAIGITADQGGKKGALVNFFGREASMSTGAVKMALKSDAAVIPCFYVRLNGPYIRVIFEPPYQLQQSGDKDADIRNNLQGLIKRFEKYIDAYSKEYLWSYKIWKYGRDKRALILSDGKTGHLRQSQAVADKLRVCLGERDNTLEVDIAEVKFKNRLARQVLGLGICLSGKYRCQGCLACLRICLDNEVYAALISHKYEFIISCGSSLAPINFLLARENLAKSCVIMRPGLMGVRKFDLVVMPRHDRPPRAVNVLSCSGALNLINDAYLSEQSRKLSEACALKQPASGLTLGLFIGGDAKNFRMPAELVAEVIKQLKLAALNTGADILATTSRRTSEVVENLLEAQLANDEHCKLLVIANKKNIPEAAGGILGLSGIVIVSPESISMISEAAGSKKYVLIFGAAGLGRRHKRFLEHFAKNNYIYPVDAAGLSAVIENIWKNKPPVCYPDDDSRLKEAVGLLI